MQNPQNATIAEDKNDPIKILVIEDNKDDQRLLLRQLHKAGVQDRVLCVDDGKTAQNLLEDGAERLTDLVAIFLDLSLPGINGRILLRAIRSRVATALLPVFVITGSTDPKEEAECQELGATGFVSKNMLLLPSFRATLAKFFTHPPDTAARSTEQNPDRKDAPITS